jgi:hypothetical protein
MPVPLLQRHVAANQFFVNEVFNFDQFGIRIGGHENHALHNFWADGFAIVVVGAVHAAVCVAVGGQNVDAVSIGRALGNFLGHWGKGRDVSHNQNHEAAKEVHDGLEKAGLPFFAAGLPDCFLHLS